MKPGLYYGPAAVRVPSILLLLALPALAAPELRWIDPQGNARTVPVAEVAVETATRIKVRLLDGKQPEVELERLIRLVRERDENAEEKALLRARTDVAAGLRPARARATLDRLAARGEREWVREYAAAARAELAVRTGEKGALDRVRKALESYPESRFRARLIRLRARLEAEATRELEPAMLAFMRAHDEIVRAHGPMLERFGTFVDSTRWVVRHDPGQVDFFLNGVEGKLRGSIADSEDPGLHEAVEAALAWARLVQHAHSAREIAAKGHAPRGARAEVARLARRTWLLAEARCDLLAELGRLHDACGEPEAARAALEKARDLAPDPGRREIAATLLARLERGQPLLAASPG